MTTAKQKSIRRTRKNPRPRISVSGKRFKIRGKGQSHPSRGRLTFGMKPRQFKRGLRKAGFRVNPLPAALAILKSAEARHYAAGKVFAKNPAFKHRGKTKVHSWQDKGGNDDVRITYHKTVIFILHTKDGTVTLDSGGWRTVTTKKRMDQAADNFGLPMRVFQKRGNWFVWNYETKKEIPFEDGMRFDPKTLVRINPRTNPMKGKHITIQEKRGQMWHTLAMFPATPEGKKNARRIGNQLHRRYPGRHFRAFG